jgi:hypothetical protein
MYASLDRIDVVSQRTNGVKEYWQTDHRGAEEIEARRALSTLFALVRILQPLRWEDPAEPRPVVIYSATNPPPEFLRQAIRAAGALLTIGDDIEPQPWPEPARPESGSFFGRAMRGLFGGGQAAAAAPAAPSLDDIVQQAFAELAREVAAAHGVGVDVEGLRVVEDAVAARQPDPEDDETAYWTAVLELGAFGGEVLRARNGGRWVQADRMGTLPFALATRYRGGDATVNPLGKAIKRLAGGEDDSVVALVQVVRANP